MSRHARRRNNHAEAVLFCGSCKGCSLSRSAMGAHDMGFHWHAVLLQHSYRLFHGAPVAVAAHNDGNFFSHSDSSAFQTFLCVSKTGALEFPASGSPEKKKAAAPKRLRSSSQNQQMVARIPQYRRNPAVRVSEKLRCSDGRKLMKAPHAGSGRPLPSICRTCLYFYFTAKPAVWQGLILHKSSPSPVPLLCRKTEAFFSLPYKSSCPLMTSLNRSPSFSAAFRQRTIRPKKISK